MRSIGQNPTEDEILEMVMETDLNGDGTIDFQEFVEMMKKKKRGQKMADTPAAMGTCVHIGGLTPEWTRDGLRHLGAPFGEVLNASGTDLLAVIPSEKAGDPLSVDGVTLRHIPLDYL